MNLESIVAQIAQTIQQEANVDAIFGQSRQLDEHVIVPVARVEIKVNAGAAVGAGPQLTGSDEDEKPVLSGGTGTGARGGFEIHVVPLGFIRDGQNGAEFMPIDPTPEGLIGKVEHLLKNLRTGNGRVGSKSASQSQS